MKENLKLNFDENAPTTSSTPVSKISNLSDTSKQRLQGVTWVKLIDYFFCTGCFSVEDIHVENYDNLLLYNRGKIKVHKEMKTSRQHMKRHVTDQHPTETLTEKQLKIAKFKTLLALFITQNGLGRSTFTKLGCLMSEFDLIHSNINQSHYSQIFLDF